MIQEAKSFKMHDPLSKQIIARRDMVFEENKRWECGAATEEIKTPTVLRDEDSCLEENKDINDAEEEHVNEAEREQGRKNVTGSYFSENGDAENDLLSPIKGRIRRAPCYLEEYITGEGLLESD